MVVHQRWCISHFVAGIAEKWWSQHMGDVDGRATRASGLEIRGESLGLTRVGYTWQCTLFKALLGFARTDSSG